MALNTCGSVITTSTRSAAPQREQQHGLADAVGPEQHDVGGIVDEGEREQLIDESAVDLRGPAPVEVGDGLEGADVYAPSS
jgi:hypothetical protein